jgi:hypothetical protein
VRLLTRKTQRSFVVALACLVAQACDLAFTGPSAIPSRPTEGDLEPNNSKATASAVRANTTTDGAVGSLFDGVDWLKIHLTAPGILAIRLTNMGRAGDGLDVQIVTGDSDMVTRDFPRFSDTGSSDTVGTFNVNAGDVWLRLAPSGFLGSCSYRITPVYTPVAVSDKGEPNGSKTTATRLIDSVTATVGFNGDMDDWYVIEPPFAGSFTVTLTNLHPSLMPPIQGSDVSLGIYRDVGGGRIEAVTTGGAEPSNSTTSELIQFGATPRFYVVVQTYYLLPLGAAPYRLVVNRR